MPDLSENIVVLRKQNKMSQSDLANELFVTPQAVSRWERGETEPDVETIKKIAEVFHSSVEEVITGPKSKLTKRISKTLRIAYFVGSALVIMLSVLCIISAFTKLSLKTFFIIFAIISLIYLLFVFTCEIVQLKLLHTKPDESDEKTTK